MECVFRVVFTRFIFLALLWSGAVYAKLGKQSETAKENSDATSMSVCHATPEEQIKIEKCLDGMAEFQCGSLPEDVRRNCFEEPEPTSINFATACGKGAWSGVKSAVSGAKDLVVKNTRNLFDNKALDKEARAAASKVCEEDPDVLAARREYENAKRNVGADSAEPIRQKYEKIYSKCHFRVIADTKGALDLNMPSATDLNKVLFCFPSTEKVKLLCEVVLPGLAGGAGIVGARLLAVKAMKEWSALKANKFKKANVQYMKKMVDDKPEGLSGAEKMNLAHLEDNSSIAENPRVQSLMQKMGVDQESMQAGMWRSDMGKQSTYRNLLIEKSPDSDRLLRVLNGQDNQTKAGRTFRELLDEDGFEGKTFLPQYEPDEIRQIMKDGKFLAGYLHETPGMLPIIDDLNAGRISPAQFKSRMRTIIGHNDGGGAGFWKMMGDNLVPMDLKGSPKARSFFRDTIMEGGVDKNGITTPNYPKPSSKEGVLHTTADRLSGATGGGNLKFFEEIHQKNMGDNMKGKMNTFRDLLEGNPKQPSNSDGTLKQLKGMEDYVRKSDRFLPEEKDALNEINRAAQNRIRAFEDFVKSSDHIEYKLDDKGNVTKMILTKDERFGRKSVVGVIDENTPPQEAMRLMKELFEAEEKVNGHPFKDLITPRKLSKTEIVAAGLTTKSLYYYCKSQKKSPVLTDDQKSGAEGFF